MLRSLVVCLYARHFGSEQVGRGQTCSLALKEPNPFLQRLSPGPDIIQGSLHLVKGSRTLEASGVAPEERETGMSVRGSVSGRAN